MTWLSSIVTRISALFRKRRLNADLDDELRFHLEMEEQDNVRGGMSAKEARRQARLRLGGLEQVKEEYRDALRIPFLESLLQDLRFAFRSFRRDPGFTATVLVTLALGIGVGTAIFAVVNGVLLQPLPYKDPDRLVTLWRVNDRDADGTRTPLSPADFYDWRDRSGLFENMVAVTPTATSFHNHGTIYRGQYVDEGFCSTLGVRPLLGRCFLPDDLRPGSTLTYMLQHDFWKRDFGGDPGVVGRTYEWINGRRQGTIIGVLPPDFVLVNRSTNWFHGRNFSSRKENRTAFNVWSIARLKAGLALKEAQAGSDVFSRRLAESYPNIHAGWHVVLIPVSEEASGNLRGPLLLLLAASGVVLLIVCLNIVGLVVVRSSVRSTEFAVRSALGAGPGRLVRQLVTENALLAIAGGLIGLVLAHFLTEYLRFWIPSTGEAESVLRTESIRVDPSVISFAVGAALISCILSGLIPALGGTSVRLARWMKEGNNSAPGGVGAQRGRLWLSAAQVALAVVLSTGACLLARSFVELHETGPGFQSEGIVALPISASHRNWVIREQGHALTWEVRVPHFERYWNRLYEDLEAIPGVRALTSTGILPMEWNKDRHTRAFWPEGGDKLQTEPILALSTFADIGYFRTLGVPLIEGRVFDRGDRAGSNAVVVLSEEAARRLWPGENPIGKKLYMGWEGEPQEPRMTVVGVVRDLRTNGLRLPPQPLVYQAAFQARTYFGYLLVKSSRDADSLVADLMSGLRAFDPDLRPHAQQYYRLDYLVRDSVWRLNYAMLPELCTAAWT